MNEKQITDLIERMRELGHIYSYQGAKKLILEYEKLNKSEKVKVPQCVHKYIQEAKEYNWDLQDLMKSIDDEDSKDLQRWFYHECNQETLARAWLDGYEVEKEKRYFVKVKATKHYISKYGTGKIFFSLAYKESFTKKELEEAGFGWVFDCPGIEIEEVE